MYFKYVECLYNCGRLQRYLVLCNYTDQYIWYFSTLLFLQSRLPILLSNVLLISKTQFPPGCPWRWLYWLAGNEIPYLSSRNPHRVPSLNTEDLHLATNMQIISLSISPNPWMLSRIKLGSISLLCFSNLTEDNTFINCLDWSLVETKNSFPESSRMTQSEVTSM